MPYLALNKCCIYRYHICSTRDWDKAIIPRNKATVVHDPCHTDFIHRLSEWSVGSVDVLVCV